MGAPFNSLPRGKIAPVEKQLGLVGKRSPCIAAP